MDISIEEEFMEERRVKRDIYMHYLRSMGLITVFLGVICYFLYQAFTVSSKILLSQW